MNETVPRTEETWRALESAYYRAAADPATGIAELYRQAMEIAALAASAFDEPRTRSYTPRWGVVYRDWLDIATQHAVQAQALGRD